MRRFLCLLAVFFPMLALSAQEPDKEMPSTAGGFPLALVLEGVEYAGDGVWRPDWPLELPPDAFKVQNGVISRCTIEWEGFLLDYRPGLAGGRPEMLPFMLNGRMIQVSLVYNDLFEIREMALSFSSGEDSWKLEILEYRDFFPYLIRASCQDGANNDGAWFFIYLSRGANEILETWYDEEGSFLWAFFYSLAETGKDHRIRAFRNYSDANTVTKVFYDSRLLITEASGPGGLYKVLYYQDDFPRYWERRPLGEGPDGTQNNAGNYSLQWDVNGLLLRFTGAGDEPIDCRYEYTLDERGNWIERREIRMLRQSGLLIPSPGTTFRRVLEYAE